MTEMPNDTQPGVRSRGQGNAARFADIETRMRDQRASPA